MADGRNHHESGDAGRDRPTSVRPRGRVGLRGGGRHAAYRVWSAPPARADRRAARRI